MSAPVTPLDEEEGKGAVMEADPDPDPDGLKSAEEDALPLPSAAPPPDPVRSRMSSSPRTPAHSASCMLNHLFSGLLFSSWNRQIAMKHESDAMRMWG
jgi:hypothetical protein